MVHVAELSRWPEIFPAAYAHAWGDGVYGLWMEIAVPGGASEATPVIQRFRWIEPGEFQMGSPEDEPERFSDESPQHRVRLTQGYWLADTACTQALWQAVTGENPSHFRDNTDCPVEQVSWDDVQAFVSKLNATIPGLGACLPTEAQWEYACRAGRQTPFWFGNTITPEQVNYDGNYPYAGGKMGEYRERTIPVKALAPNGWGVYQMHGNVLEWCTDGLREYAAGDETDPEGPESGDRAVRGGSWFYNAGSTRSAYRFARAPAYRYNNLGFRLCLRSTSPGAPGRGAEVGGDRPPADMGYLAQWAFDRGATGFGARSNDDRRSPDAGKGSETEDAPRTSAMGARTAETPHEALTSSEKRSPGFDVPSEESSSQGERESEQVSSKTATQRPLEFPNWRNTVLWVDDRPDNNLMERAYLEERGIHFVLALSTAEALEQLRGQRFGAIISDMGRKEGSRAGYDFLETMRKTDSETPFFIYAGSRSPDHVAEGIRRGAQGVSNDPFELAQMLLQRIQESLTPERLATDSPSSAQRLRERLRASKATSVAPTENETIYLIFAESDQAMGEAIAKHLRRAGLKVSTGAHMSLSGSFSAEESLFYLNSATAVLTLMSKALLKSEGALAAAGFAFSIGKLMPVLIEEIPFSSPFANVPSATLIGWNGDETANEWRELIKALDHKLEQG